MLGIQNILQLVWVMVCDRRCVAHRSDGVTDATNADGTRRSSTLEAYEPECSTSMEVVGQHYSQHCRPCVSMCIILSDM